MVDAKKIEKKIPCMLSKGWWSKDYDMVSYRQRQFKKKAPEIFVPKLNKLVNDYTDLQQSMDNWWLENHKKHNGQR